MKSNSELQFASQLQRKWTILRRETQQLRQLLKSVVQLNNQSEISLYRQHEQVRQQEIAWKQSCDELIALLASQPHTALPEMSEKATLNQLSRHCAKVVADILRNSDTQLQSPLSVQIRSIEPSPVVSSSSEDSETVIELESLLSDVNKLRSELFDIPQEELLDVAPVHPSLKKWEPIKEDSSSVVPMLMTRPVKAASLLKESTSVAMGPRSDSNSEPMPRHESQSQGLNQGLNVSGSNSAVPGSPSSAAASGSTSTGFNSSAGRAGASDKVDSGLPPEGSDLSLPSNLKLSIRTKLATQIINTQGPDRERLLNQLVWQLLSENEPGLAATLNRTLVAPTIPAAILTSVQLQPFVQNADSALAQRYWSLWESFRLPARMQPGSDFAIAYSILVKSAIGLSSLSVSHPAVGKVLRNFPIESDTPGLYNLFNRCRLFNHRVDDQIGPIGWLSPESTQPHDSNQTSSSQALQSQAQQWLQSQAPQLLSAKLQTPLFQKSLWSLKDTTHHTAAVAEELSRYAECCCKIVEAARLIAQGHLEQRNRFSETLRDVKLLLPSLSVVPEALRRFLPILEQTRIQSSTSVPSGSERDLMKQEIRSEVQQRVPELFTWIQQEFETGSLQTRGAVVTLQGTLRQMLDLVSSGADSQSTQQHHLQPQRVEHAEWLRIDPDLFDASCMLVTKESQLQLRLLTSLAEQTVPSWDQLFEAATRSAMQQDTPNLLLARQLISVNWIWSKNQLATLTEIVSSEATASQAKKTFDSPGAINEPDALSQKFDQDLSSAQQTGIQFDSSDVPGYPSDVRPDDTDHQGWVMDLF